MNSTSTQDRLRALFDGRQPVLPADRHYALALCGVTQSQIAQELKISRGQVCNVLADRHTSFPVAAAVSAHTGVPLKRLWPDGKYDRTPAEARRARLAAQAKRRAA